MIAPLALLILVILAATGILPNTPVIRDIYNGLVVILIIMSVIEYRRGK